MWQRAINIVAPARAGIQGHGCKGYPHKELSAVVKSNRPAGIAVMALLSHILQRRGDG